MSYRNVEEHVGGAITLAGVIGFFIGVGLTSVAVMCVMFFRGGA